MLLLFKTAELTLLSLVSLFAKIAEMAGIEVEPDTKVLIGEVTDICEEEPFAHEKLSPVLAMYKAKDFDDAVQKAYDLVDFGGAGQTSVLYTDERFPERIEAFGLKLHTSRILINSPSSQGGIGDLYNFRLNPSLTLGCGSWGGNAVSDNVGPQHLLNIKTVAERRENMLFGTKFLENLLQKRGFGSGSQRIARQKTCIYRYRQIPVQLRYGKCNYKHTG